MDSSRLTGLAQTDGGQIDPGPSMWSAFQHGLEHSKGRFAIICPFQDRDYLQHIVGPSNHHFNHLAWTYEQLCYGSSRLAATFQAHGVLPGSTIVFLIRNSPEWALLWFTAAIGRYTIGFCDPRAVKSGRAEELSYFLRILKPSLVVVDDESGIEPISKAASNLSLELVLGLCLQSNFSAGKLWKSLADIGREDYGQAVAPLTDDLDRVATVMFTNGTSTGYPKGAPRSVRNWLTCAVSRAMLPISAETILSLTTLCFRAQANTLALCVWYSGGTIIIPDPMMNFDRLVDAVDKYNVNLLLPGLYQLFPIMEAPSFSAEKFKKVKTIYIAGDVLTTQLLKRWQTTFPETHVINKYGMTEGSGCIGWPNNEVPDPIPTHRDIVSVGKAGLGAKLRIVGSDGQLVSRREVGELHIGGTVMTAGYLDGVQPESFYHDAEGAWIKTGDTAMIDEDDQLFILGRTKDIITRIGVPISPSNVESCLSQQGGVIAQVVGVPSERMGEEMYAVLELQPKRASLEDLKEEVVQRFGAEYTVTDIFTLADLGLSEWPKTGVEKILKKDLRTAIIQHLEINK